MYITPIRIITKQYLAMLTQFFSPSCGDKSNPPFSLPTVE